MTEMPEAPWALGAMEERAVDYELER